jgi:hypothetical protein
MRAISQITLQRAVTTFNLGSDYFDKIALVNSDDVPHLRGIKSNLIQINSNFFSVSSSRANSTNKHR